MYNCPNSFSAISAQLCNYRCWPNVKWLRAPSERLIDHVSSFHPGDSGTPNCKPLTWRQISLILWWTKKCMNILQCNWCHYTRFPALKFRKRARMVYCTKIDSGFLSCCLEIILEVQEGLSPPFRPAVSLDTCGVKWMALMASCWSENPESRPKINQILKNIKILNSGMWVDASYLPLLLWLKPHLFHPTVIVFWGYYDHWRSHGEQLLYLRRVLKVQIWKSEIAFKILKFFTCDRNEVQNFELLNTHFYKLVCVIVLL